MRNTNVFNTSKQHQIPFCEHHFLGAISSCLSKKVARRQSFFDPKRTSVGRCFGSKKLNCRRATCFSLASGAQRNLRKKSSTKFKTSKSKQAIQTSKNIFLLLFANVHIFTNFEK